MGRTPRDGGGAKQHKIIVGIIFEEDGWFYAVCLNHFLMTMARRKDDLDTAIQRMVKTYVGACKRQNKTPFEALGPAPDEYWARWFHGEAMLRKEPHEDVPLELLVGYEFRSAEAV